MRNTRVRENFLKLRRPVKYKTKFRFCNSIRNPPLTNMPKHSRSGSESEEDNEETPENSVSDSEPEDPQPQTPGNNGVSEYEKQRLSRIAENRARMEALGLPKFASSLLGSAQKVSNNNKNKNKKKGKEKVDDDDYRPDEVEEEPSSSSEEEEDGDENEDYSSGSRRKKVWLSNLCACI